MKRQLVGTVVALVLCLTVPLAYGQRGKGGEKEEKGGESRAKGGEKPGEGKQEKGGEPRAKGAEKPGEESKPGNKPPGGAWSEGKQSPGKEAEGKNKSTEPTGAEGAAAASAANKNKQPSATGAEGAAAGAAASNRNKPATSGAEGAAAGAAASNRNKPEASGAEGAAAGAAAANRNKPAASGAEGAAAGAAAANRNKPAASGAEGAAAGAAAARRNQPAVSGTEAAALGATAANRNHSGTSGAAGVAAGYAAVRNSFDHPSVYNQQWYANNPGVWNATNIAGSVWVGSNLAAVSNHCGYANSTPISYGYGDNVTCQNGNVMIDGNNVGTAEDYSQQAADLAWVGQQAETQDNDKWLPLGVFALVRNTDQQPQVTLQIATNSAGILRGNYTDLVSDHTLDIHGAIEKETQRAAWTIDNKKNFFMEAGLTNLTSGEAPTLIHKSGRTEKWLLVRLPDPASADVASTAPAPGQ